MASLWPGGWICSSRYVHSPRDPLPLILVDEPSASRRYAIQPLDARRIPWRQAYLAFNLIGI